MELFKQPIGDCGASLTAYLHDDSPEMPKMSTRPAVIICPGGGYAFVSARESEPIALAFLNMGFHAFVLDYTTQGENRLPFTGKVEHPLGMQPLTELAQAIVLLRQNSKVWRLQPEKIAVCGFSAGAHLAGSLGTLFADDALCNAVGATPAQMRPDAMILAYPVITQNEFAHESSILHLVGLNASVEARAKVSLELQVSDQTPPTFLWHTVTDAGVPVENSLLMATALQKHKVPFELHLFHGGAHGLSLATASVNTPNTHVAHWVQLCEEWLKAQFQTEF